MADLRFYEHGFRTSSRSFSHFLVLTVVMKSSQKIQRGRKATNGGVPPNHNSSYPQDGASDSDVSSSMFAHDSPQDLESSDPDSATTETGTDPYQALREVNQAIVNNIATRAFVLASIRAQLTPRQWNQFKNNAVCPVSKDQAEELPELALNDAMLEERNYHLLPASEECLLALNELPANVLQHAISIGQIRPNMSLDECRCLIGNFKRMLRLRILMGEE